MQKGDRPRGMPEGAQHPNLEVRGLPLFEGRSLPEPSPDRLPDPEFRQWTDREGMIWGVTMRHRMPHISGGRRPPRITFSGAEQKCRTSYYREKPLAELVDEELEHLLAEARDQGW